MHADLDNFMMPSTVEVESVVTRLQLLADPTRLRIVAALAQGESDVGCLAVLACAGAPAVSQHLAKLRLAGTVKARRDGQRVIYELVDQAAADLVANFFGGSPDSSTAGRRSRLA